MVLFPENLESNNKACRKGPCAGRRICTIQYFDCDVPEGTREPAIARDKYSFILRLIFYWRSFGSREKKIVSFCRESVVVFWKEALFLCLHVYYALFLFHFF